MTDTLLIELNWTDGYVHVKLFASCYVLWLSTLYLRLAFAHHYFLTNRQPGMCSEKLGAWKYERDTR